MPGRDGTGPIGKGAMTGRGAGRCGGERRGGGGRGCGFGFGGRGRRGGVTGAVPAAGSPHDVLLDEAAALQRRLDELKKAIEGGNGTQNT